MPPDLLVILCDTARADLFGPWGGPHPSPEVDRLCREGTRYANAVAPAPWTLPSIASLLCGALPTEHGIGGDAIRYVDGRPTSPAAAVGAYPGAWLPQALRDRGYRTVGVSCNPWISRWGGFDRGFDAFDDVAPHGGAAPGTWARRARRVRQAFGRQDHGGRRALEALRSRIAATDGGPLFSFVNLMEAHAPYDPPLRDHPVVRGPTPGARSPALLYQQLRQMGLRWRVEPGFVRAVRTLYYAAGRYEDRLVGDLVRAADRGRPRVVAVVGDHGENLGDHGLFAHHSSLHQTLLHVPAVVWGRGVDLAGGNVQPPVSIARLFGWALGVADGPAAPLAPDGPALSEYESTVRHMGMPTYLARRIAQGDTAGIPRLVHHAGVAIRDGDRKYIGLADGSEEMFDLSTDPDEARDLLGTEPDAARPYQAHRDAWLARRASLEGGSVATPPEDASAQPAEDDIADHLRMLGYIE